MFSQTTHAPSSLVQLQGVATPTEHKSKVQSCYTQLADTFEKWTPSAAFRETFHRSVLDEVRRRLAANPRIRILEIGCGHGTWAAEIYDNIPQADTNVEYVGIDFTPIRIEAGRKLLTAHPTANLVLADCEQYAPDRPFDLILAVEVISHVPFDKYPDWFSRWRSWLAPGGSAIVIDKERFSKHNLRLKWDTFKRRHLPRFLVRGGSYYFTEDFSEYVHTLNYPSFRYMRGVAQRVGFCSRPVFRNGLFRSLTADLPS